MAMHSLLGHAFDKLANVKDQKDPMFSALACLKLLSHSLKPVEQGSAKAPGIEFGVPGKQK